MNYNVVTVTPMDNLLTSVSRMNKFGIGSVVVEDSGRPVGILTERDVVRVVEASKDRRMMELVVKDDSSYFGNQYYVIGHHTGKFVIQNERALRPQL